MRLAAMGVGVASLLFLAGSAGATDDGWDTYGNARFGFHVCYPRKLLVPQGEPDNGDGNTFKSADKQITVVAYGRYELEADKGKTPLETAYKLDLDAMQKEGFKVTYSVQKPKLYALSGAQVQDIAQPRIRYIKVFKIQDRNIALEATYPQAQAAMMDPVVTRMAGCLAGEKQDF